MWPKLLKSVKLDHKVTFLRKTFDCIFQSVYAVSNCIGMFRIARNHSKKYHLCQKPDRSASARIWIFVLTSPSSGLFWKLWLSPLTPRKCSSILRGGGSSLTGRQRTSEVPCTRSPEGPGSHPKLNVPLVALLTFLGSVEIYSSRLLKKKYDKLWGLPRRVFTLFKSC